MLITRAHKFLTAPTTKTSSRQFIFWLTLSITLALLFSLLALNEAFSSNYVVQDDARQHVVWMRRFLDSSFPNDFIADYYLSVAPPGYTAFYRAFAIAGIDPVVVSKIVPVVLGLISTVYGFGVSMQILPVPTAGFMTTLILNQNLWLKDDLATGTARAFAYPLFLAFLYYLLRRSLLPCLATVLLIGLFYPSFILIVAGILFVRILSWDGKLSLSRRKNYLFCAIGLGLAVLVMLPYVLTPSEFGQTYTLAQAQAMPEFSADGRTSFFIPNRREFWLFAGRSGFFPSEWRGLPYNYFPLLLCVGLLLPLMWRYNVRFPLVKQITSAVIILPQIALVSVSLFLAAHLLLFKLYLPSRYTQPSLRMLTAIAAGIALTVLLDAAFRVKLRAQQSILGKSIVAVSLAALLGVLLAFYTTFSVRQIAAVAAGVFLLLLIDAIWLARSNTTSKQSFATIFLAAILAIGLISYPALLLSKDFNFPATGYQVGKFPELYAFFAQQPKDITIASLEREASNLPAFSHRSVLVAREFAIPYHTGYYNELRQRLLDLIDAQYSPDREQLSSFIQKYSVDFFVVDRDRLLTPYLPSDRGAREVNNNLWINQYQPAAAMAETRFKQGIVPAMAKLADRCSVFETQGLRVIQAECLTKAP
ncbi:hypothetical protein [Chroococcidiopsis sp. TS-821]|uniref:hypothetical protein n=1 Tax=Chroococcidiopsis sp. TS-821 TaxID=1378066 RepID=UPI000CEEA7D5|nr:hypothetical protein [Chroococcidiopsis sp. TS-821]PPS45889.1 hypothetical protein B1A85_06585 [Chroococcidiopsis sp. TS-821]